jgi:outer membrane protein OmpA-like peptidoglycan-associated protein
VKSTTMIKHVVMAGALAGTAWGCGASAPSQELVDARRAYERAQTSPASQYTPDDLLTARQALDRAEAAHEDDPGSSKEAHLAYLAARRAQIASARGELMQAKKSEAKATADYHARLEQTAESSQGQLAKTQSELEQAREAQAQSDAARQQAEQRMQAALQSLSQVATVREESRGTVITLSGAVLFPSGGDELSPIARQTLDRVAEALKDEQPEGAIVIEGHTDSRGNADMNDGLSQRRAQAVGSYLASRGLDQSRIQAVGRGENQPIASNDSPDGRANNRRVEIVLGRGGAAMQGASGTSPATSRPAPGSAAKTLPDDPQQQRMQMQQPQPGAQQPRPGMQQPQQQPQQPRTQPPAPSGGGATQSD